MAWMNKDGLLLQYGTEKAVPTTGGDFRSPGELRVAEVVIDLTKLTTTPQIADNAKTTFFGQDMFIEQVDVVADKAAVGGTSVSVGLLDYDGVTPISSTAFVNGATVGTLSSDGKKLNLTLGVSGAGSYVGKTSAKPGYISAHVAGTFTAGILTVRIKYRGVPPITR